MCVCWNGVVFEVSMCVCVCWNGVVFEVSVQIYVGMLYKCLIPILCWDGIQVCRYQYCVGVVLKCADTSIALHTELNFFNKSAFL